MARQDTNGVAYYFSDHLKTADVITDPTGKITSESDYYPWGGELPFLANDSNHYKFTGKQRDGETGLDYFGARYYSNGLGRFISADWSATPVPVPYADFGDPQSLNQYSYVRNIPTTRFDADGHQQVATPPTTAPDPTAEEVDEVIEALEDLGKLGPLGIGSAILTGVVIVYGPPMLFPDKFPGGKVGQSNDEERAQIEQASQERAAQNGGVDPQAQPLPQAQADIEAARKSTRTIRREWEKAKGKKWPKEKEGKNYDADHRKALADGGSNNAARNIQPRTHRDHVTRHKRRGDFKRWAKRRNKNDSPLR